MKLFKTSVGILLIVLLMFSSSLITGQQISDRGNRPDVIFKHREYNSRVNIIMGNTSSSRLELMYTTSNNDMRQNIVRGSPNISINGSEIELSGNLTSIQSFGYKNVKTFFQKDAYIEGLPVDERVHTTSSDRGTNNETYELTQSFEIPQSYDELVDNTNFYLYRSDERDLTAFISRSGTINSIPLNGSDGNEIGKIVGFRLNLVIFVFKSSTKQFVGIHRVIESGYGNIIPEGFRAQLLNSTFNRDTRKALGSRQLNGGGSIINWLDLGFNETLGLQMYRALFSHQKETTTMLIQPTAVNGISLNQVPLGLEELITTLDLSNTLIEIDDVKLVELDSSYSSQVIKSPTDDNEENSNPGIFTFINQETIFIAQILGLFVLTIILARRFRR